MAPIEDLSGFVTIKISQLQNRLNAQAARLLSETAGISLTQWRVMVILNSLDQASIGQLVDVMGFDKALISRSVKALHELGLVSVEENKEDLRTKSIMLSETGNALYAKTLPTMQQRQQTLIDAMADGERELFERILDKLTLAVTEAEREAERRG